MCVCVCVCVRGVEAWIEKTVQLKVPTRVFITVADPGIGSGGGGGGGGAQVRVWQGVG